MYEEIKYDELGQLISSPGKLEKFQKKSDRIIFYVTEDIPQDEWDDLSDYITANFPNINYQFQLAPGVTGPGICPNQEEEKAEVLDPARLKKDYTIEKNSCFSSNDPDYLAEKLLRLLTTQPVAQAGEQKESDGGSSDTLDCFASLAKTEGARNDGRGARNDGKKRKQKSIYY